MQFAFLSQKLFFSCCIEQLKKVRILNVGKYVFDKLTSHSFDYLQYSPIVYKKHMKLIFQDLPFLLQQVSLRKQRTFCLHFCETHLLVLDQNLMYFKVS